MASTTKAAAIFFILLLAGNEVAEGRRALDRNKAALGGGAQTTAVGSAPFTDETADVVWQRENNHCRSRFAFWCKEGQAHHSNESVTMCASQPLARDFSPSSKCRVTDAWMLEGTEEKPVAWWVRLQARVLASKSDKFSADCNDGYMHWATGLCRRRLGHIIRATKFISKASAGQALERLTPAEQTEVRDANIESQDRLASLVFTGEAAKQKKALLKRLVDAMRADPEALAKHPAASAKLLLEAFQEISADPAAAEEKVAEIERNPGQVVVEGTPEDTSAFESSDSPAELAAMLDSSLQVLDDKATEQEEAAIAAGQDPDSTSLVEMRGALRGDGMQIVVKVLLVLFVIWLVFAAAALVGGFFFWAAVIAGVCAYKTSEGDEMLPCMGDYLSRPFIWLHDNLKEALGGL